MFAPALWKYVGQAGITVSKEETSWFRREWSRINSTRHKLTLARASNEESHACGGNSRQKWPRCRTHPGMRWNQTRTAPEKRSEPAAPDGNTKQNVKTAKKARISAQHLQLPYQATLNGETFLRKRNYTMHRAQQQMKRLVSLHEILSGYCSSVSHSGSNTSNWVRCNGLCLELSLATKWSQGDVTLRWNYRLGHFTNQTIRTKMYKWRTTKQAHYVAGQRPVGVARRLLQSTHHFSLSLSQQLLRRRLRRYEARDENFVSREISRQSLQKWKRSTLCAVRDAEKDREAESEATFGSLKKKKGEMECSLYTDLEFSFRELLSQGRQPHLRVMNQSLTLIALELQWKINRTWTAESCMEVLQPRLRHCCEVNPDSTGSKENYNRLQNGWELLTVFDEFSNIIPIPGKTSPLPPAQCWPNTKWP